jgi:hypothetical protein
MMIEYDKSTLAPLGLVVGPDELLGKRIAVIDSGIQECVLDFEAQEGMEGMDCAQATLDSREQALILMDRDDETNNAVVIQPNEDGSYWRKIVRNKMIREREKRRENAAKEYISSMTAHHHTLGYNNNGSGGASSSSSSSEVDVVSSWGPYTSTKGTAKKTGIAGLTMPAAR